MAVSDLVRSMAVRRARVGSRGKSRAEWRNGWEEASEGAMEGAPAAPSVKMAIERRSASFIGDCRLAPMRLDTSPYATSTRACRVTVKVGMRGEGSWGRRRGDSGARARYCAGMGI